MLADKVRGILAEVPEVSERKMFGGVAFMVSNNMALGILGDELMVRVGAEAWAQALGEPGVQEMDFTGRSMRGFVVVGAELLEVDARLEAWVERGVSFAESLPPKEAKAG